jgi:hypothetical protein
VSIFLPGRGVRVAGVRQKGPAHRLAVDWTHPLARGLVWCFAPTSGGLGDLVGGGRAPTLNSGGSWKGHPHGLALDSNTGTTNASGAYFPWSGQLATITTRCSIAVWASSSLVNWNADLWSAPNSASWVDPHWALVLARQSFTTNGGLYFTYGGAGTGRTAFSAAGFYVDSVTTDVLYGATRDGTAAAFWRNGVPWGTGTFAGNEAVYWANQRGPGVLNHGDTALTATSEGVVGRVPFAAVWNRPLAAPEWAQLSADPYCFLRPAAAAWLVLSEAPAAPGGLPMPVAVYDYRRRRV